MQIAQDVSSTQTSLALGSTFVVDVDGRVTVIVAASSDSSSRMPPESSTLTSSWRTTTSS